MGNGNSFKHLKTKEVNELIKSTKCELLDLIIVILHVVVCTVDRNMLKVLLFLLKDVFKSLKSFGVIEFIYSI